jgi:succinate dehydrogenase / fumarate reductase, iron-sulfur subunit
LQVKIYRFDPSIDTDGHFDSFEVPALPHWTVMDALDYVSENFDSSIAYFKHGACDHGICGRCSLNVNGKVRLACSTEISDKKILELKPVNDKIIRDLVVRS